MRKIAKKKTRKRRKFTIPLTIVGSVFGALAGGAYSPVGFAMQGNYNEAALALVHRFTGWHMRDEKWDAGGLMKGLGVVLIGCAAHWVASKLGVNRYLGRAGVPIIRI